jgi:hypothetical protein
MNRDRLSRHLLAGFLLALFLYIAAFWLIESRRTAKAPWTVSFEANPAGQAQLQISQGTSGLGPVEIRFTVPPTNPPLRRREVVFRDPKPVPFDLPMGRCKFQDLTFLPGTVAINVCGTDIQLLPRMLTVGTNEFEWSATHVVELLPDGSAHRLR